MNLELLWVVWGVGDRQDLNQGAWDRAGSLWDLMRSSKSPGIETSLQMKSIEAKHVSFLCDRWLQSLNACSHPFTAGTNGHWLSSKAFGHVLCFLPTQLLSVSHLWHQGAHQNILQTTCLIVFNVIACFVFNSFVFFKNNVWTALSSFTRKMQFKNEINA